MRPVRPWCMHSRPAIQTTALLHDVSQYQQQRLQRVLNAAAWLISRLPKYYHISPVLKDLHWLSIKYRVIFKITLLVFKVLHGLAPLVGGRVGPVVRALAFHQCGPGSISAPSVICGLSLLVLYSAMRGFPLGTPVFPSHQKPTFDLI